MYSFHATIHVAPASLAAGPSVRLRARDLPTLQSAQLDAPFPVTFEEALEAFERHGRMFCEPDGSFVWVSPAGEPAWQLDGQLYDLNDRLLYVELKGTCPPENLDALLRDLGWPEVRLVFQLVHEAVLLSEDAFRLYASQD